MRITFLGAAGTVTGSKYLVETRGKRLLVDCGLFQGLKELRLRNWAPPAFDPAQLDAVLLTHAHVDHSGYLPLVARRGFKGAVHCTRATRDLCRILLPDTAHLQEEEAEFANRRGYSKHHPALPLFTAKDAEDALGRFDAIDFEQKLDLGDGITTVMRRAGHILGAASIELSDGETSVVFSGDVGRPDDPLVGSPAVLGEAQHLVVESTYGDRRHGDVDPERLLADVVHDAVARGGAIIIPAFAVGRAQLLLWHLQRLKERGAIPRDLPVILDSPMAVKVTELFCNHEDEHDRGLPEKWQAACGLAEQVSSVEESKAVDRRKGSFVLVSASGMATGGRILHHLAALAPDPKHVILLAGYQAAGTRGASLANGAATLRIHGQDVPVRAQVMMLPNLSAHADSDELMAWMKSVKSAPRHCFVTHGEPRAAAALRRRIATELGWQASVPEHGRSVTLEAARA